MNRTVTAIADAYLLELAAVEPDAATAAGREPASALPGFAPDDFDRQLTAARRAAIELAGATPAGPAEEALAAALGERLAAEISLDEAGFTQALLAPLATPVHRIRQVFDALPRVTDADWDYLGQQLDGVPGALAGYRATLTRSADRGSVVAARQICTVAAQCRQWIRDNDFYGRLAAGATNRLRATVGAAADRASEATLVFADFLTGDLLPRATRPDAVGRDVYRATAGAFLGAGIDLDETYAWGWAELDRISAEIDLVARQIGTDGYPAVAALLDADPARRIYQPAEVEAWLTERVTTVADAIDGVQVDLVPQARLPECRISAAASGVMYYSPPDPALTRPGQVWWTYEPELGVHTWREATTVHHEGVPGHHLQITTALATAALHPWQRAICHVHGYAEGWAHHSEEWAGEIGLLDDPADRLGMLLGQAWRAARIVIDAGLHLDLEIPAGRIDGADRWSVDLGVDFLQRTAGLTRAMAAFEVDRYLGWPAQALAFRVGARLFAEIRRAAQERDGAAFDSRAFHNGLLRLGPMGLDPLRRLTLG